TGRIRSTQSRRTLTIGYEVARRWSAMTRWTSAEIRPFVAEAVASHEAIIAEGRCTAWIPANFWTVANNPAYLVNNPVYIVVTKSRLLWRHLGASGDPAAFPLSELARADIESAQE